MNWKTYVVAIGGLFTLLDAALAQSTAFIYQGHLSMAGSPANGNFDLVFALYDSPSNGYQQGPSITNLGVPVTNGLFLVTNDFGAAPWNGQALWLQLQVRTNNGGAFTTLSPLQPALSSPYSIQSLNAINASNAVLASNAILSATASSVASSNIAGTILNSSLPSNPNFSGTVTAGSVTAGTFSGSGSGLTALPSIPWPLNVQPVPDLGFDSWNVFLSTWGNTNASGVGTNSEGWLTNMILLMGSSTVQYGWDHLWMTDGTFYTRDGDGNLIWNTNIFTRGMAYYTGLAHSNGVKLLCYTSMNPLTCGYNPGLGYGPGNYIQQDLDRMMALGFDGTMIDVCDDGENFGNTNVVETFWRNVHDAIVAYQTAVMATNGAVRPFQIQCTPEGNNIGQQFVTPSQYATCQDFSLNAAGGLDFPSALTNAHAIFNSWSQLIGKSKYPFPQSVYDPGEFPSQDTNTMNMYSMFLGEMRAAGGSVSSSSLSALYAVFSVQFTPQIFFNTNVLAIYLDPACIPAAVVWSNSLDEVWMRPLGGAGVPHEAVLCVNDNLSSQTFTVNVGSLLLQSNTVYALSDPYQGGAVISNFQNSFTLTVSPTNSRLVRVDLNSLSVAGTATLGANLIVSSGEDVTGGGTTNTTAQGFVGNGANLTNLNASFITSGTLSYAVLPLGVITNGQSGVGLSGTFSGSFSAPTGFTSLATNKAAPLSTTGVTNTNAVTWVYDIAATNVTIAQFDGQTNWWDTNAAFTGSKELIIQAGGGWTNTGIVTVTGAHAF
jgi:hypothetical protein